VRDLGLSAMFHLDHDSLEDDTLEEHNLEKIILKPDYLEDRRDPTDPDYLEEQSQGKEEIPVDDDPDYPEDCRDLM
jgi:hypothetical protein